MPDSVLPPYGGNNMNCSWRTRLYRMVVAKKKERVLRGFIRFIYVMKPRSTLFMGVPPPTILVLASERRKVKGIACEGGWIRAATTNCPAVCLGSKVN